tara:strand:- start:70 stop:279 length:210 start_codon:yes stop_codon:yes gene_type:complete
MNKDKYGIPMKIEIEVYYYINDAGEYIIDADGMNQELIDAMKSLNKLIDEKNNWEQKTNSSVELGEITQ